MYSITVNEYLPLLHIPIPKRHNPVVVMPTKSKVVVKVVPSGGGVNVVGNIPPDVTTEAQIFFSTLSKYLGIKDLGLTLNVELSESLNTCFLYVAITNTVVEYLAGRIDEDLVKVLQRIDSDVGMDDSVLALRYLSMSRNPYIWRLGEDLVELDESLHINVIFRRRCPEVSYAEYPPLTDLITHLAGMTIIEGFKNLRNRDILKYVIRVINSLWHMMYGVPTPNSDQYELVIKELMGCSLISFELT